VVIKADGCAREKAYLWAPNPDAATDFIERVMEKNELGDGGSALCWRKLWKERSFSFILLTDGERYAPLVPTRDHKRAFDNNQGPSAASPF